MQGIADWAKIRAVKEAVSVPVVANGNILFYGDIARCLEATGADAVMSAEGNLYNPAIFIPSPSSPPASAGSISTAAAECLTGYHPRNTALALEYLEIVKGQKTLTTPSAVKGHLFKLLRPALSRYTDLRERLGKVRVEKADRDRDNATAWEGYVDIIRELDARLEVRRLRACMRGYVDDADGGWRAEGHRGGGGQVPRGALACRRGDGVPYPPALARAAVHPAAARRTCCCAAACTKRESRRGGSR